MNEQTYTRVNESTFPEKRLEGNKELNLDEQQKKVQFLHLRNIHFVT